jgi:transposase
LRIRLTAGQRHEMTQAEALIDGLPAQFVIADTAFDADAFRARLAANGSPAVIPSNRSRTVPIPHDRELYKERHLVECFINRIKHFRRIATRYEKTATAFLAMITLAATMTWLR